MEEQPSPSTKESSQGFKILHRKKRLRIYVNVNTTKESEKTTFDGLGETFILTQSSEQSTQSPTLSTTS